MSCYFRRSSCSLPERFRRTGRRSQVSLARAARRRGLGQPREPDWHLAWRRRSQQLAAMVLPGWRRVLLPEAVVVRRARLLWPAFAVMPELALVRPVLRVSVLASMIARWARLLRWVRWVLVVVRELALVRSGLPVGVLVALFLARRDPDEQSHRAVQWVSHLLVIGFQSIEVWEFPEMRRWQLRISPRR